MNDLEKVIKGLKCCELIHRGGLLEESCNLCPYQQNKNQTCEAYELFFDARQHLKEQEPRVLTLEEVESSEDSVWLDKDIPELEPMPVLVNETGRYLDTFITRSGWRFQGEKSRGYGEYGKTWRCWSAKPTDAQREAVPWDD